MHERMGPLIELLTKSREVTFIIPSLIFNEEYDPDNHYKKVRDSYDYLKNDETLEILEVPINPGADDELLEITIRIK